MLCHEYDLLCLCNECSELGDHNIMTTRWIMRCNIYSRSVCRINTISRHPIINYTVILGFSKINSRRKKINKICKHVKQKPSPSIISLHKSAFDFCDLCLTDFPTFPQLSDQNHMK